MHFGVWSYCKDFGRLERDGGKAFIEIMGDRRGKVRQSFLLFGFGVYALFHQGSNPIPCTFCEHLL
jgi:hypothetical protein